MVLCLLSFLFGVYTGRMLLMQKQWMWWAAPRTFDIFVPFACLHSSWACDQPKQVMPFAALWRCVRMSKETCRRWPVASGMALQFCFPYIVFPSSIGQGFCLFVSASEGCRQLLESLACSHLPYSEAELHKCRSCHDVQTGRFLWFSSFWSLQVPSAALSATRPDFKPTWPGNRQMHAHKLALMDFLYIPRVSLRLQL